MVHITHVAALINHIDLLTINCNGLIVSILNITPFYSLLTNELNRSMPRSQRMQPSSHGAEIEIMLPRKEIWILDTDMHGHKPLLKELRARGFETRQFKTPQDLWLEEKALTETVILANMDAQGSLNSLRDRFPDVPVILMTACPALEKAISAYQCGAFEYLSKPYNLDEALGLIRRACTEGHLRATAAPITGIPVTDIIGGAPAMHEVFRTIARLAQSDVTVLIQGESGTGKEMAARALHRYSPRARAPLVAMNLTTIPANSMNAEWFGHTGDSGLGEVSACRLGRLQQADGGTLLLNEIAEIPPELQSQLVRILTDGEFFPHGSRTAVRVNVRIIATTQRNLETLVAEGKFREDLYHRLNVVRINLPPLRERGQDIPLLLRHFLKLASRELKVETKILDSEVESFLCGLDWPGNVRQLENACRSITARVMGKEVLMEDLPPELFQTTHPLSPLIAEQWEEVFRHWVRLKLSKGTRNIAKDAIIQAESILIETALNMTHGRREEAAKLLGYGRNTVTRKITELKLPLPEIRS